MQEKEEAIEVELSGKVAQLLLQQLLQPDVLQPWLET